MPKAKKQAPKPLIKVRTPNDMADAAIRRFVTATAAGASVDSEAWKKAISDEARVFAQEIIMAAAQVAGGPDGKDIIEALAGAAG